MKYRKSSYSNSNANCVEVGSKPGIVAVRDTKDNGNGPVLRFSPDAWARFTRELKKLRQAKGRGSPPRGRDRPDCLPHRRRRSGRCPYHGYRHESGICRPRQLAAEGYAAQTARSYWRTAR